MRSRLPVLQSPALRGGLYALFAYIAWGLSPIFWKQLTRFPPQSMLAYRVIWSCILLLILAVFFSKSVLKQTQKMLSLRPMLLICAAAALIAGNWYTYIWAVTEHRILDASLGYYLNPLANIAIGVIFFRERLSLLRWCAFLGALLAVTILIIGYGELPWIALVLAGTFSVYGVCKKLLDLSAAFTLGMETLLILPLACLLIESAAPQGAAWLLLTMNDHLWFLASGFLTLLPLFAFGRAARLLPYSTLGFFQYIAPTLQLICAVILYNEPFSGYRRLSFGLIWLALLALTIEQLWLLRRKQQSRQTGKKRTDK